MQTTRLAGWQNPYISLNGPSHAPTPRASLADQEEDRKDVPVCDLRLHTGLVHRPFNLFSSFERSTTLQTAHQVQIDPQEDLYRHFHGFPSSPVVPNRRIDSLLSLFNEDLPMETTNILASRIGELDSGDLEIRKPTLPSFSAKSVITCLR